MMAEAGLYAPEAELLSMNAIVGVTNGMFSLHNYGLTTAFGGFGPFLRGGFEVGDTSGSVGYLSYSPSASDVEGKLEELSSHCYSRFPSSRAYVCCWLLRHPSKTIS